MKTLLKWVDSALDRLISLTEMLSVILMLLLAIFIFAQAFCRYVLSIHIPGLFDVSIYSLIFFTFFSGAYTLREGAHISVDLISVLIPERSRAGLELAVGIAGVLFIAAMVWFSLRWAQLSFSSGVMTISETPIPKWVLIASITAGFLLMGFQIVRQFAAAWAKSRGGWIPASGAGFRHSPFVPLMLFLLGIVLSLFVATQVNKGFGLGLLATVVLLSGMPVCFALGFVGSVGLYLLIGGPALGQIPFLAFKAVESFPLTCLPLFIIAGIIMEKGKLVDEVFRLLRMISGNTPSAPLLTTILAGGFFCAVSGSSVATTSLIAAATLPMFMAHGYRKSLASGTVAGATIGTVIPPSIGYILYGVITEESIGRLFMAGVIPAVVIFGFYFLYTILRASISPGSLFEPDRQGGVGAIPADETREKRKVVSAAWRSAWGLFAPVFVLGGIYLGVFTPSEAAAVMFVYAVVISLWVMKTLTMRELFESMRIGAKVCSMILLVIVGAKIFGALTSQLRIAPDLVAFASREGISSLGSLALISVMLLALGMFLDAASTMVITLPIFYPLMMSMGFDSVWLGVFYIVILEIGLLTPPVGLNLFVIKGISGFPMGPIVRGALPFIGMMLLALLLLALFPQLATWLPSHMVG